MAIPLKYTFKNFQNRKTTSIITLVGIALVVFVFATVLMMAYGIQKTLVSTGSPDNVIILRKAANGEISSIIDGETQAVIRTLPHIAKTPEGIPALSGEAVSVINLEKQGGLSNVTVRAVSPEARFLRPQIKLVEGKWFNPGLKELVIGESVQKNFTNMAIGSKIRISGENWTITGIFDTDGSGFDSEIWADAKEMLNALNRGNSVSTLTLKLDDIENFEKFKMAFAADRRLTQFEVKGEQQFFEEQSESLAMFIKVLGIFITVIFSFGATIGAMITMYTSVANRTVEIGTMRSLGFSRRSILTAFLIESLLIALTGGLIGIFFASFMQFFQISTINFNSFAELSFKFALNPDIIVSSLIFAVVMGFLGGFLPSVRAARMKIVNALRSS